MDGACHRRAVSGRTGKALTACVRPLRDGAISTFLLASLAVGLAQGAASTSVIRALLAKASLEESAGLLATIYLISYCGAALPALVAGELGSAIDLLQLAEAYAGLGIAAALLAIVTVSNQPTIPQTIVSSEP